MGRDFGRQDASLLQPTFGISLVLLGARSRVCRHFQSNGGSEFAGDDGTIDAIPGARRQSSTATVPDRTCRTCGLYRYGDRKYDEGPRRTQSGGRVRIPAALHRSDRVSASPPRRGGECRAYLKCSTSFSFSVQKYSYRSWSGIRVCRSVYVNRLPYALGSSIVTSISRWPTSRRRKRSIKCRSELCGWPIRSSQPPSLTPLLSTTSAS